MWDYGASIICAHFCTDSSNNIVILIPSPDDLSLGCLPEFPLAGVTDVCLSSGSRCHARMIAEARVLLSVSAQPCKGNFRSTKDSPPAVAFVDSVDSRLVRGGHAPGAPASAATKCMCAINHIEHP